MKEMREMERKLDTMSKEDLRKLNKMIVSRLNELTSREAKEKTREIIVGDRVQFKTKKGITVYGIVRKINPTTIVVVEESNPMKTWKVHASLIEKA